MIEYMYLNYKSIDTEPVMFVVIYIYIYKKQKKVKMVSMDYVLNWQLFWYFSF